MKITKGLIEDSEILTTITKKSKAYWGFPDDILKQWEQLLTITKDYIEENEVYMLIENEQEYQLEYLVPGFKKEEIKVANEQNVLTVKAEKKTVTTDEQKRYTRKEFSFSSFKRSFTLPENINAEQMVAKHEHGILCVIIPKKMEEKKNGLKEIEIL